MRRAQDRAQSARSRKNGARSATFKNSGARDENVPAKWADFLNYKNIQLIKNVAISICRSFCSKQFCILTFFSHLVYTEKNS